MEKEQYIIFMEAYVEKLKKGRITFSEEDIEELETAIKEIKDLIKEYKQKIEIEKEKANLQIIDNEFFSIGYKRIDRGENIICYEQSKCIPDYIQFDKKDKTIMKYDDSYEETYSPITLQELKVILHLIEILGWNIEKEKNP